MSAKAKKAVILSVCILSGAIAIFWIISTPRSRDLDPTPITKQVTDGAFEPGIARVALEMDTSGDQMGMVPKQVGLRLIVRYGNTMQYQLFASCNNAGFMGAGGDMPEFPIEADCDGKAIQISPSGKMVIVNEMDSSKKVLTQIYLPQEIQKVIWDPELHSY